MEDYHLLDFSERLNTSSYVNVVFEPEEEKVALMGLKVNLADQTVYPESFRAPPLKKEFEWSLIEFDRNFIRIKA